MDNDAVRLMAVALTGHVLNFSSAVAILIVGWWAAGWVRRGIAGTLDREPRIDATLKPIIANMGRYGVLILVVIAVLARFGVQTASVITILGAAALAIGLALQGTLSNIAAGFMLLLLRPFRVGENIDAEGIAGTVSEVGLFTTQLKTFDGIFVSAPNSKLWNSTIRNYSHLPTKRIDLAVVVGYADDIEKGMSVLLDLLKGDSRVLAEPAPEVMVTALGESAVNLNMRCWVGPRRLLGGALRHHPGRQGGPRDGWPHDSLPPARCTSAPQRRPARKSLTPITETPSIKKHHLSNDFICDSPK